MPTTPSRRIASLPNPISKTSIISLADFAGQMAQISNRYLNAAHHVDRQMGRVIAHLRQKGMLDDTIVIVWDPGEEFMERSTRWGRRQSQTPPDEHAGGVGCRARSRGSRHHQPPRHARHGDAAARRAQPTSGLFARAEPAGDYFHRDYAVAADWHRVAYIGETRSPSRSTLPGSYARKCSTATIGRLPIASRRKARFARRRSR